jgi:hypothetical protein
LTLVWSFYQLCKRRCLGCVWCKRGHIIKDKLYIYYVYHIATAYSENRTTRPVYYICIVFQISYIGPGVENGFSVILFSWIVRGRTKPPITILPSPMWSSKKKILIFPFLNYINSLYIRKTGSIVNSIHWKKRINFV